VQYFPIFGFYFSITCVTVMTQLISLREASKSFPCFSHMLKNTVSTN